MTELFRRHPWVPYVVPFVTFMVLLGLSDVLPVPPKAMSIGWLVVMTAVVLVFARPVWSFRLERPVATIAIGVLVFGLWILPDQLFPSYRESVLLQNSITGRVESGLPVELRTDPLILALRFLRASLIVPIVEELFWRAWLPRWVDHPEDFRKSPLGTFTRFSFLATTILFAVEHGAFWDVGLVAGAIYNWWMIRTRSLGDLIWCHAVTNGCLSAWVLATGQWGYW